MRRNPCLYEINARLWLKRLSQQYGKKLSLTTIPDVEWQEIHRRGFDYIWLMGVWQRSPASRRQARLDPALRREYAKALPGWSEEDIDGSPYAVFDYRLDPVLGKPGELAKLKKKLHRHGLGLVLDFVPNHLAVDHHWVASHPGWFVRGNAETLQKHPEWFFSPKPKVSLAHGRDPNFLPWTDTAQLDYYSTDLRKHLIGELCRVADVADGVRGDMAMLVLNEVFGKTWGEAVAGRPVPKTEFWTEAIGRVRRKKPGFLFIAEVYWGLEEKLQELGFDYAYNKNLYDKLRNAAPGEIRRLLTDTTYPGRSVNFIENHDEIRAASAFGRERSLAAATVIATLPGLRLLHDGQLSGRRLRLPVQMVREPDETPDDIISRFYEKLLTIINRPVFHEGGCQLLEMAPAGEGDKSYGNLLAWSWRFGEDTAIVVINYAEQPSQGRLPLPLPETKASNLVFYDDLTGAVYDRDPTEVRNQGLYIALEPYQSHIFSLKMK